MSLKTDWGSENFDLFFYRVANGIPTADREKLPTEYKSTLWRGNGSVNPNALKRFKFLDRAYVLNKAGGKIIYCVIEDEENGMTIEEFFEWKKEIKKKDRLSNGRVEMHFCLANKELSSVFNYLNQVYHGPSYNYRMKLKKPIPNPAVDYQKEMKSIVRMLMLWESRKREFENEFNINLPELYTLLAVYSEGEIKGSEIYKTLFVRAHDSSPRRIKQGFSSLRAKGMIQKHGNTSQTTFKITAAGIDAVNRIVNKYALKLSN